MSENREASKIQTLGGNPEGRIQRYFCVDDEHCHAFSHVSEEAALVKRTPKQVKVGGETVDGWIVEVMVPATDGVIRNDPLADRNTKELPL